jgi:hypothetical protein
MESTSALDVPLRTLAVDLIVGDDVLHGIVEGETRRLRCDRDAIRDRAFTLAEQIARLFLLLVLGGFFDQLAAAVVANLVEPAALANLAHLSPLFFRPANGDHASHVGFVRCIVVPAKNGKRDVRSAIRRTPVPVVSQVVHKVQEGMAVVNSKQMVKDSLSEFVKARRP